MTLKKQASSGSYTNSSLDASLRMAAPALACPDISNGNSSDQSTLLVGQLRADGLALLRPAQPEARANDVDGAIPVPKVTNSDDPGIATRLRAASASSDENYDALSIDPATVVRGGKGGGLKSTATLSTPLRLSSVTAAEKAGLLDPSNPATNAESPSLHERHSSISVRLEKTGTKGRYLLKAADEPELREILRVWARREVDGLDKKRRSKFSDLVFTRQFTTFDRQNPTSASSLFHGFFTLFWLGTFLLLVKIAARNWKIHGSVFGPNEILQMMFHEDVLVLGLTDGVMCASTAFCLVLQKAILAGYLSWNRHGWIIQNVGEEFLFLKVMEDQGNLMLACSCLKCGTKEKGYLLSLFLSSQLLYGSSRIASGRTKRTSLTVFRLMACFVDSSVDHRQSYV